MGYCDQPGCMSTIDTDKQQERHDEIFPNNCGEYGCFSGSARKHMMKRRHRVCGFGTCKGKNVRFKSDGDVRRHWNDKHRGNDLMIMEDRFGRDLYEDEDDLDGGYYSEAA